jgi:hypothetical protein
MATVRNFEIMLGKFNLDRVCTTENYAQKWIANLYNYLFVVLAIHSEVMQEVLASTYFIIYRFRGD